MSAKIVEDAVEISWEYTQTGRSFRGYYISDVGTNEKENPCMCTCLKCPDHRTETCNNFPADGKYSINLCRFLLIIKLVLQSLSTQRNLVCTCTCNMVFSMTKNKVRMAISNSFLAAFLHVETINIHVSNVSNVSANFVWTHYSKKQHPPHQI